jgi:hypothetical protein
MSLMRQNHYYTDISQSMKIIIFLILCMLVLVAYLNLIAQGIANYNIKFTINFDIFESIGICFFTFYSSLLIDLFAQYKQTFAHFNEVEN